MDRVDIAGGIRLMNDYIGGSTHVVSTDPEGRVTRQAERNLYLPQPNWLAFSGGQYIDVCKLERIDYAETGRKISWRTVLSPNGSAVHDDGSIAFQRLDDDHTKVTVCGLQLFTLPPMWTAAEPWLTPAVKDALVEDSYRRFFTATLDNVEAAYEGRDYRIGHEPTSEARQSWDQRVEQLLEVVRSALPDDPMGELAKRLRERGKPEPDLVDELGFQHFSNARPPRRRNLRGSGHCVPGRRSSQRCCGLTCPAGTDGRRSGEGGGHRGQRPDRCAGRAGVAGGWA